MPTPAAHGVADAPTVGTCRAHQRSTASSWALAKEAAQARGRNEQIQCLDLLRGLLVLGRGIAGTVLGQAGVSLERLDEMEQPNPLGAAVNAGRVP